MSNYNQNEVQANKQFVKKMKSIDEISHLLHKPQEYRKNQYIDQLDRFTRDFANVDKKCRDEQIRRKKQDYEHRRKINIQKENNKSKNQEQNLHKYLATINHSQELHALRIKKTAHTNSLPFNPITLQYENTPAGQMLKQQQEQNTLNKLVRAHNLQTKGNTGYNLLNGQKQNMVQKLIPPNLQDRFSEKIKSHYEKYSIKNCISNDYC